MGWPPSTLFSENHTNTPPTSQKEQKQQQPCHQQQQQAQSQSQSQPQQRRRTKRERGAAVGDIQQQQKKKKCISYNNNINHPSCHNSNKIIMSSTQHHHQPSLYAPASAAACWTAEAVASLPPPGMSGPSQITFSPNLPRQYQNQQNVDKATNNINNNIVKTKQQNKRQHRYLAYVTSPSAVIRTAKNPPALYRPLTSAGGCGASGDRDGTSSSKSHLRHHSSSSSSSPSSSSTRLIPVNNNNTATAMGAERMLMYLDLTEAAALLEGMDPDYYNNNGFLDNDSFHSAASSSSHHGNSSSNTKPASSSPSPSSRSKSAAATSATTASSPSSSSSASSPLTSSVPIVVSGTSGHTCCSRVIAPPTPLLNLTTTRNNNNNNNNNSRQRILENHDHYSSNKNTTATTLVNSSANNTTSSGGGGQLSLEERLRRERQRLTASPGALTQFSWAWSSSLPCCNNNDNNNAPERQQPPPCSPQTDQRDAAANTEMYEPQEPQQQHQLLEPPSLRILIPARGSLYMQEGVMPPPPCPSSSCSSSTTATTPKDAVASFFLSTLAASSSSPSSSQSTNAATANAAVSSSTKTKRENNSNNNNNINPPPPLVRCIHDKIHNGGPAVDPQLSPDGSMVAWTFDGEVFVQSTLFHHQQQQQQQQQQRQSSPPIMPPRTPAGTSSTTATTASSTTLPSPTPPPPIQITFGAQQQGNNNNNNSCISHGIAEFVAQEEMDRYRGFWWHPDSTGIMLTRVDETPVPPFRIVHHGSSSSSNVAATGATDHHAAAAGGGGGGSSSVATTTTATTSSQSGSSMQPDDASTTSAAAAAAAAAASGMGITYEEHRYPFAGKENPKVQLLYVVIDRDSIVNQQYSTTTTTAAAAGSTASAGAATATTTAAGMQRYPQVNRAMSRDDEEDEDDVDVDLMDMCPPRRHYNNQHHDDQHHQHDEQHHQQHCCSKAQKIAIENWNSCIWFDSPREASEYLARVHWLPDGSAAIAQWQNRAQTVTVLTRMDIRNTAIIINNNNSSNNSSNNTATNNNNSNDKITKNHRTGKARTLLIERSEVWINLHHMFKVLARPIHPDECVAGGSSSLEQQQQQQQQQQRPAPMLPPAHALPEGSFSFIFASERSGYSHLYLYTYVPGINGEHAMLLRTISAGDWMVESIVGVDLDKDVVYLTGTSDSVLERHLYALPITNRRLLPPTAQASASSASSSMTTASPEGSRNGHPKYLHHQNSNSSGGSANNGGASSMILSLTTEEAATATGSSAPSPMAVSPNGVRRGLSKVIHALSGKSNSGKSGANHSSNTSNTRQTEAIWSSRRPIRLTVESGMHSIVMDEDCQFFVDTSSDLDRPMTVRIYALPENILGTAPGSSSSSNNNNSTNPTNGSHRIVLRLVYTLYDALLEDKSVTNALYGNNLAAKSEAARALNGSRLLLTFFRAPELMSFPTSDGSETLHAAVYRPDPSIHGPGPYPLICAVYGGPHVQRVNRSWSQCSDMRAQRLRSLGFCVVKCDNRGSSRRGLAFESAIARRLGRLEVLDQVAVVRQLTVRGVVDPTRVGVYGWSYGGYLAAMCLARAPDIFTCAVAGAPVTSWDGYDTHYTERYMGLPSDNIAGYRESAVLDHVPNIRGKLLLVHGLIDENVHFRHTARLINKLVASGKDYELLIFPEERHSPRRLRDRIYMEQRISDFFVRQLHQQGAAVFSSSSSPSMTSAGTDLRTSGSTNVVAHHQRHYPSSSSSSSSPGNRMPGHL